jgi:hypothetical protein
MFSGVLNVIPVFILIVACPLVVYTYFLPLQTSTLSPDSLNTPFHLNFKSTGKDS